MLHPQPHDTTSENPIIELRSVSCGYDHHNVLENLSVKIMTGDFVGLLGPSGSGKSTLLRAILGTAKLYSGQILIDKHVMHKKQPLIGYVPQLETIDWDFPVTAEQVILMGRITLSPWLPWHSDQDREKSMDIMRQLGIVHLRKKHIRELSGGEQQRVFLARALVGNPKILLLDEPVSGMDIKTRDDTMHVLDQLNHEGITILMTTHEINSVAAHLPWVICLNKSIIAEGPPSTVFTADILYKTYNAQMPITKFEGLTIVAEKPHIFGKK